MENTKQTFNDILEIAKLLELGQLTQAGKAWEAQRYEYSCFLKTLVSAMWEKEDDKGSVTEVIVSALDDVSEDIGFAYYMYERNFDERWSYIAKKTNEDEFFLALKACGQMEDFEELIENATALTGKQLDK